MKRRVNIVVIAAGLLLIGRVSLETAISHSWDYKPPRDISTTPGTPWQGFVKNAPPSLARPVPGGTGVGARMPVGPGRGAGAGAFTKKNRAPSRTDVTWEDWWARNRYPYLSFSDDAVDFPVTPVKQDGLPQAMAFESRLRSTMRVLLEHDSARLRRAALIGLARLDDHDSLPAMMNLLDDRNQTVRDSALLSLGLVRHEKAEHLLLHVAKGSSLAADAMGRSSMPSYFRAFAALALSLNRTEGTAALLRSLAHDASSPAEVRAMALEGLGILGGPENVKFLILFLDGGELEASALNALGRTGDALAVPVLLKRLSADSAALRRSAALALGSVSRPADPRVVKKLHRCARHTSDAVARGFCLVSMGRIGGCEAIDSLDFFLMKGRKSEAPWACLGLGLALRREADERMEKRLVRLATGHGNRSTRGAAVIALGLVRSRSAVKPLIRILEHGDDPCLRGYCALALGMIGDRNAGKPLRKSLKEEGLVQLTTQAALGLSLLGDRGIIPDLLDRMLHSENDCTKASISLGLSYMGDLEPVRKLADVIGEEELDDLTLMHLVHLTTKLLSGQRAPYLDGFASGSNPAADAPLVDYLLQFDL